MAVWRDGVSITVEVAFQSAPLATSPTWTDVTAYLREVPSIFRGRTSEYDDFAPGTCEVILDNRDRRFDPDFTAGAYYPNVVPMKRLKVTWAFAAASGVAFTGWVLGWPQEEINPSDGFVTVTAVDGGRFWENQPLAGSAYGTEVAADSPSHYWPLQEIAAPFSDIVGSLTLNESNVAALTVSDQVAPVGQSQSVGLVPVTGSPAPAKLQSPTLLAAQPRTIEAWIDFDATVSYSAFAPAVSVAKTLTSSASLLSIYQVNGTIRIAYDNPGTAQTHSPTTNTKIATAIGGLRHVVVTTDASNVYLYIDAVLEYTGALSAGAPAAAGAQPGVQIYTNDIDGLSPTVSNEVSHVAVYDAELSAARIAAHHSAGRAAYAGETSGARIGRVLDEINWPAGLRDIDTGQPGQGPYLPNDQNAMDVIRQVERSEQGMVFTDVDGQLNMIDRQALWTTTTVATFTDDAAAGDLKYIEAVRGSHVDTIRNIVTASWRLGGITRRDQTSITAYGEARESVDSVTLGTAELASNLAAYVLRTKKDPAARVSELTVPVRISSGDNEAEKLLALELGDRIMVERTPVGVGPQVAKAVIVQGIEHEITVDQWTVRLYTSPAPLSNWEAPYLTVADTTFGRVGVGIEDALLDEFGDALDDENGDPLLDESATMSGNLVPF